MLDNQPRGTICIEDLEIGMIRSLQKTITDRDIELFAEVSTDRNPVHLDEAYAQDTIFQGRIAHGMLTAGLISPGDIELMKIMEEPQEIVDCIFDCYERMGIAPTKAERQEILGI